jgi:uncharacterized membrane protein YfcA
VSEVAIYAGLVVLGLSVGGYGTMIGAGGGFVLVPLLLLLYPSREPDFVTSVSLAVVFFNAASGTLAYVRQRRVDYLAANLFAAATIPGAVAGAFVIGYVPREVFDVVFALLLLAIAAFLLVRPSPTIQVVQRTNRRGEVSRMITDHEGVMYAYSYNVWTGVATSTGVGFASSLLGIGGGVIHVPIMVRVLRFPAHIATATSHYVLMVSALAGTLVHVSTGQLDGGYGITGALAAGVLMGAQVGAQLSNRIRGDLLIRLLGAALAVTSIRLLIGAAIG